MLTALSTALIYHAHFARSYSLAALLALLLVCVSPWFLHARDGTDPRMLLEMATTNGARGLGYHPACVSLDPGGAAPLAGILAAPIDPRSPVDPLAQVLARDEAPAWLLGPAPGATLAAAITRGGTGEA